MKIRNEKIINKLKKSQRKPSTDEKYNEVKLKKYEELKADLCPIEDATDIFGLWILISFSIIGIIIFLDVFLSLFSDRTDFNVVFSTMPYVISSIFILAGSVFIMFYLNSKITQSALSVDEKIERLENNKLVSGFSLTFVKIMIFSFFILLLFSFYCYFDPEIKHPFGNSFIIYLLLMILINIVKKNVSFFYHITFAIISCILYLFNYIAFSDLAYAEEDNEDNIHQTQSVDPDDRINLDEYRNNEGDVEPYMPEYKTQNEQ